MPCLPYQGILVICGRQFYKLTLSNTNIGARMKKVTFLFICTILFFTGCKKDSSNPETPGSGTVIVPLAVGNNWIYTDSLFNTSTGAFVQAGASKLGITGKQTISYHGQTREVFWWNWYNYSSNSYSTDNFLVGNESDGFSSYGWAPNSTPIITERSFAIKYPCSVGDTWQTINYRYTSQTNYYAHDTEFVTCTSLDQVVATPSGSFHCIVMKRVYSVDKSFTFMYVSPGVGIIATTEYTATGILAYKQSLLSCTIN